MRRIVLAAMLAAAALGATVTPASAHQPVFEVLDITAHNPWRIEDPQISTAVYATLGNSEDVDYFVFDGHRGEALYVGIVIPQIEGQETFAPLLAVMGTGLGEEILPERVQRPQVRGAQIIVAPAGEPQLFFEPFSRTSYWERQERDLVLAADGLVVLAVWHPEGRTGRYVLVVGKQERLGGDLLFPLKMPCYWQPVDQSEPQSWFGRLWEGTVCKLLWK